MGGQHFEEIAEAYDGARPAYPPEAWDILAALGVTAPGNRVLEIGAGTGLATRVLVEAGCEVVAVEPGARLAAVLRSALPSVEVVVAPFEAADLPVDGFDAVVAATALHWVDLDVGLPKISGALRPCGLLAVWRTVFFDDVRTDFRDRVAAAVAQRGTTGHRDREVRPTVEELTRGRLFELELSQEWRWSVDLTTAQVRALFRTFSDWTEAEVDAAASAADDLGGVVTEHYRTVLHVLRRP